MGGRGKRRISPTLDDQCNKNRLSQSKNTGKGEKGGRGGGEPLLFLFSFLSLGKGRQKGERGGESLSLSFPLLFSLSNLKIFLSNRDSRGG